MSTYDRMLADYQTLHATWIRADFDWNQIEPAQGSFDWTPWDQWVADARGRGLNILATIAYTPPWANGGSTDPHTQPSSASVFATFAGQVAARYAAKGVHAYEIWNEPNIGFWQPVPNPVYYTQVLCAAYQAIHQADPQATVVTGGTSPAGNGSSSYSPQTWLTDLYADGAKNCFDAVAHHPYIDGSSTPGDLGNAWYLMSGGCCGNLRQIMTANNDSAKRIWATEVGCNPTSLGNTECSNRITEAFGLWKGYSWAGVLAWFTFWDPNVYGLVDGNWNPRPEFYAYQSAAASFPPGG